MTPLELFFDLMFVFAITQVTGFIAAHPTWTRLGEAPFLGGASYSIADIATFPWARNVGTLLGKSAEADYPKLMAWVETIAARPQFDKAGAQAMDRLFGRGRHTAAA